MSNQGGQWNNPEWDNPQPYSDPEEHQPTYPGSGYAGDPGQYQGWASPPPPPPPAYTNPYADTNPYAESSAYSGSSSQTIGDYQQKAVPVPRRRRRSWLWLVITLLILVVLCGGGISLSLYVYRTFTQSVTSGTIGLIPTFGTTQQTGPTSVPVGVGIHPIIVINRNAGSVHVHATSTNNMVIIQPAQQSSPLDNGPIPYSRGSDGKTITFDLSNFETEDIELMVPRLSDLNITTNSDDITVDGVSGQITLKSNAGTLTATHVSLSGQSTLKTNGGNITFSGSLNPGGTYLFDSNGGSIVLTLPHNAAFHVDATTNGGSVRSDFPQVTVSGTGDEAHGDVGKGPRAQVTVSNNGGSITLHKS